MAVRWASTPVWNSNPVTRVRFPSSAPTQQRQIMAKHFYHIPLQKTLNFIKEHKPSLNTLARDKKMLSYHRQLGKSRYTLELETFITFFKIDKDLDYALKTMEYFNSSVFISQIHKVLNFSQFHLTRHNIQEKDFFYAFCDLYGKKDNVHFKHFMEKTFLHYHTAFNPDSNIQIDHQDMSHILAKSKKVKLKESFGEMDGIAFFKIFVDGCVVVEEKGKRIKTLRKKAYNKLFYYLIELEEKKQDDESLAVYEKMQEIL